VTLPEPPRGWREDEITRFLDHARLNSFASYANLRPGYAKLSEVDAVFRRLLDNLFHTRD
jgi:hypothetical protein